MSILTVEPMTKFSQVHTTTDYFLFNSIDGNRKVNRLHLKRLMKSMQDNYLFTVIIVNENYQIIDGQHRFNVIKELGLPLHYIICEGYGLDEVHILNANSKNWNADDYLEGYCNLGYDDYLTYRDFKNAYGFNHNECMVLLTGNNNGDAIKMFSMGKFKVNDLNEAKRKADLIYMIEPYYDGFKRRTFIYAILSLLKKKNFEFTEFISKLKQQPTTLQDCTTVSQYISLIEEIYNYRRRDKVNLRF